MRSLDDDGFKAGNVHTGYLDGNPEIAQGAERDADSEARLLAVASLLTRPVRDAADAIPALHASLGCWRN